MCALAMKHSAMRYACISPSYWSISRAYQLTPYINSVFNFKDKSVIALPCTATRQFSSSVRSRTALYDILDVSPRATHAQVKTAYYKLSKLYHPDVNKTADAKVRYSEIVEAYEVLGNKRHRRMYDSGIFTNDISSDVDSEIHNPQDSAFRPDGGFRKRNKAPPTGRSHVYNYDEFYRMHYKESFQRAKDIKTDKKNEHTRHRTQHGSDAARHVACLALISASVVFLINKWRGV